MMSLAKETLKQVFNDAREAGEPYVFVSIKAEGVDEVIVIPKQSFDDKEYFYLNAYDDDLKHVMNKNVYVSRICTGDETRLPNII